LGDYWLMLRRAGLLFCSLLLLSLLCLHAPSKIQAEGSPPPSLADRYRRALAVDPDNLKLRYYLGVALLGRNQPDAALVELRLAYPEYQDSVEANYNLGIAYLQIGDSDSALLHLEQAEVLGAGDQPDVYPLVDTYYNLALINFDQDHRDEAIRLFTRVLELSPERREVERLIGDLHARDGRDEDALAAF
jgi:tetratricopeptide (TPR) repeat protein